MYLAVSADLIQFGTLSLLMSAIFNGRITKTKKEKCYGF